MSDINKVILVGRLGSDPILRQTQSGIPVANFPLATSRRVKNGKSGRSRKVDSEGLGGLTGSEVGAESAAGTSSEISGDSKKTQWHRVVVWGIQGKACADHLRKGSLVYLEGEVRSRKYEDKDGISRMQFEVHADQVSFLSSRGRVPVEALADQTLQ